MATILVIEDERFLGRLYRKELERDGYRVVIAPDAAAARVALRSEPLDLVVVGIHPRESEKLDTIPDLCASDRRLPMIVHSGKSPAYRDHALQRLADAWVDKRSDTTELRTTIRRLLRPGPARAAARQIEL